VHLRRLQPVLQSIVNWIDEDGASDRTWGVVWDFLALPQRGRTSAYDAAVDDRTPEQRARFKAGLAHINEWYGHPHSTVILLDGAMSEDAPNKTPYSQRGWCIFERRLASVIKDNDCLLSLSAMCGRSLYWPGMRVECAAARAPPITPDAFEALVRGGMEDGSVKFTNGKDATEVLIPQFREGFDRLMNEAVEFDLHDLGWGDAESVVFAHVLAYAHSRGLLQHVVRLNLIRNSIGDEGMLALAGVLRQGAMPRLKFKNLAISFNPASKAAQEELRAALKQRRGEDSRPQTAPDSGGMGGARPVTAPEGADKQRRGRRVRTRMDAEGPL